MSFKRFLLFMFVAALTAGTSTAASVLLRVAADDHAIVKIDDNVVIEYADVIGSDPFTTFAVLNLTDGWHDISIAYRNNGGANGLTMYETSPATNMELGSVVGLEFLKSFNLSGVWINGLRGEYYTLQGDPITTWTYPGPVLSPKVQYGAGPIQFTGGSGAWDEFGPSFTFAETLTGKIYFGPDTHPSLNPPPVDPPVDPPNGDGDVPEPSGLWLVAAAVPLFLISRRLKYARTRQ